MTKIKRFSKFLVVNADDFGWSEGVNRAIEDCFKEGVVTSTSLTANAPAFKDAVFRAKKMPGLGVGVHLNFFRFSPVLPKQEVRSLINKEGLFFADLRKIVPKLITRNIKIKEIEKELRVQIEKILESGINPTHLDSENHLHVWPSVFEIVCRLAKEYNIKFVRIIKEDPFVFSFKSIVLNQLSKIDKKYYQNLITINNTIGLSERPGKTKQTKNLIKNLPERLTEFIVHPIYRDNFLSKTISTSELKIREQETNILKEKSLREFIRKEKINLINFKNYG